MFNSFEKVIKKYKLYLLAQGFQKRAILAVRGENANEQLASRWRLF